MKTKFKIGNKAEDFGCCLPMEAGAMTAEELLEFGGGR